MTITINTRTKKVQEKPTPKETQWNQTDLDATAYIGYVSALSEKITDMCETEGQRKALYDRTCMILKKSLEL